MQKKNESVNRFLTTLMFLLFFLNTRGQQWLPDFKHYTPRDGLPSSEVYQITSDPQKNLWFATDRGAVRYDGYSFRTFDIKDSLPDNSVIKLYKDGKGRIWFISYTCVLSYYEKGKIIPYKYNNLVASHFSKTIITSLYVDESENVHLNSIEGSTYTITSNGQFIKHDVNARTSLFVINSTNPSSVITNYLIGSDRSITTITVQSLRDTFSFTINETIRYNHFATTKLRNNDLIFYCERFLIRIHPSGKYEIKKMEVPVLNVFEDDEKNIWVGTKLNGVYVYDSTMSVSRQYLKDFSVTHVYRDIEGGFWLSTHENGIFYLSSKNNSNFALQENLFHDKITAVVNSADSVLFFATSKGILFKCNNFNHTVNKTDLKKDISPNVESVTSLYFKGNERELAIGTVINFKSELSPVYLTSWSDNKLFVLPSLTKCILRRNGNLLGSDYSFVFNFNLDNKTLEHINKNSIRSTALFEDSKGRLFSGTLNGLYILKENNFIPFDTSAKLLRSRITDINELDNKYIIISTRSNGIIIYRDSIIDIINSSDGLTSDNINRIGVESNEIWAGTNKGLSKITIKNQSPFSFAIDRFNVSNGLVSDEVNDFAIGKKLVYVATNEGLSVVDKEKIKSKSNELPLYITAVRINERDTLLSSSYSLAYNQNYIGISFTALSFRNSKNIIYRYRLLGQDTTWRSTSNRDVQFSGLSSGSYNFQLLASHENGIYTKVPVEISFSISPSFYETIWFRLSIAVICLLVLFAIINYRIKIIQKKADEQNALNKKFSELNLNALRSQMNPHFTFNVLNSIQYYIVKKDADSAQLYISKFSKLIRMILDQSRTEFISLAEEIKILTLYMELEELRFEKKFSYSIKANERLNTEAIYIPGMLIQPFVENSIKHGIRFKKGEAQVGINFTSSDSVLICTITDNGIGRAEAAKLKSTEEEHRSMGTAIVNERIEALSILFKGKLKNYTTDLKDEHGNPTGTCVTIEIPFKKSLQ